MSNQQTSKYLLELLERVLPHHNLPHANAESIDICAPFTKPREPDTLHAAGEQTRQEDLSLPAFSLNGFPSMTSGAM